MAESVHRGRVGWEITIGWASLVKNPRKLRPESLRRGGWRPGQLRPLVYMQPSPGSMTSEHHIYRADSATHIGEPEDAHESAGISWVPPSAIPGPISSGDISSGATLVTLLHLIAIVDGPRS